LEATVSSLDLQKAVRAKLINAAGVTSLVPAASIFDRHGRPETFPCVLLGEDQEISEDLTLDNGWLRVFPTLHVWTAEPGTTGAKSIARAIRAALASGVTLEEGGRIIRLRFASARYLRDPDGEHAHGVVTFEALILQESEDA
jgi:hypothetical protein